MKRSTACSAVAAVAFVTGMCSAAWPQSSVQIVRPGEEHWSAGAGRDRGAWLAHFAGNPAHPGLYVFRVKMPAGFTFTPHVHNAPEFATVISGTVLFGTGARTDRAQAK